MDLSARAMRGLRADLLAISSDRLWPSRPHAHSTAKLTQAARLDIDLGLPAKLTQHTLTLHHNRSEWWCLGWGMNECCRNKLEDHQVPKFKRDDVGKGRRIGHGAFCIACLSFDKVDTQV